MREVNLEIALSRVTKLAMFLAIVKQHNKPIESDSSFDFMEDFDISKYRERMTKASL